MQTVNEAVRKKLEKYLEREAKLALEAIALAEKYGNEASVAEQLAAVVRRLVRGASRP